MSGGRGESALANQIARALKELDIIWIAAHSPQAKGRVERGFRTRQDRLVKGGRRDHDKPANPDNANRPLDKYHDLTAILSHMETRRVANDYTIQFEPKVYQIASKDIRAGLRGGDVRVGRDPSVDRFHTNMPSSSLVDT